MITARQAFRWTAGLVFLLLLASAQLRARDGNVDRRPAAPVAPIPHDRPGITYRLPAEFEHQEAVLLAGGSLLGDFPALFADVVSNLRTEVAVYVLVNDEEEREAAGHLLRKRGIPADAATFLTVPHDSPWVRDYGPFVVLDHRGAPVLVDARYHTPGRDADEKASFDLAHLFRLPLERTDLLIEGGNILTNGDGLLITSTRLLDFNKEISVTEEEVRAELRRVYGAIQVLFLEPVLTEPTGHVDTFATFVSADTVMVASCDPEKDPLNAALLDRNAIRLATARTASGPLRVIRIPTPHHEDGIWRTYTNVIYANGVVLVPVYPGIDPGGRERALRTFQRFLPERRIVAIDAGEVAPWEGALHCMSMNLGPARLPSPGRTRERKALKRAFSEVCE